MYHVLLLVDDGDEDADVSDNKDQVDEGMCIPLLIEILSLKLSFNRLISNVS